MVKELEEAVSVRDLDDIRDTRSGDDQTIPARSAELNIGHLYQVLDRAVRGTVGLDDVAAGDEPIALLASVGLAGREEALPS